MAKYPGTQKNQVTELIGENARLCRRVADLRLMVHHYDNALHKAEKYIKQPDKMLEFLREERLRIAGVIE